jgi:hypothetical protein
MRTLALVTVTVAVAAFGASDRAGSAVGAETSLTISFRERDGATPLVRTLRCDPPGGSLPRPTRACAALAALARPFAPIPKNVACTEIYGGPQTALVTGTYRGRRIWARFARRNGCEIDRWTRHGFLFPAVREAS